jgi:hypothetical protein
LASALTALARVVHTRQNFFGMGSPFPQGNFHLFFGLPFLGLHLNAGGFGAPAGAAPHAGADREAMRADMRAQLSANIYQLLGFLLLIYLLFFF